MGKFNRFRLFKSEDYSAVDGTVDWDNFDYKTLAKILYMGKLYE